MAWQGLLMISPRVQLLTVRVRLTADAGFVRQRMDSVLRWGRSLTSSPHIPSRIHQSIYLFVAHDTCGALLNCTLHPQGEIIIKPRRKGAR